MCLPGRDPGLKPSFAEFRNCTPVMSPHNPHLPCWFLFAALYRLPSLRPHFVSFLSLAYILDNKSRVSPTWGDKELRTQVLYSYLLSTKSVHFFPIKRTFLKGHFMKAKTGLHSKSESSIIVDYEGVARVHFIDGIK